MGAVAAVSLGAICAAPALAQQDLCPSDNPVIQENNCSGAGSAGWILSNFNDNVAGFSTQTSVNLGTSVSLKIGRVNAAAPSSVNVDVYRMGYYGNEGGRLIAGASHAGVAVNNLFGSCTSDATTGKKSCANWGVSYTIPGASLPASGVYIAKLTDPVGGGQNTITFTVRDDARTPKAQVLFEVPSATYEAYNDWGGKSLYYDSGGGGNTISGDGRAVKVSFDRPHADPRTQNTFIGGVDFFMVQWLEKQGYDVSYTDDVSLSQSPGQLLGHQIDMVSGHSEYWSLEQFNGFLAARNAGVNLASFSSNTSYWKVRYEDNGRTLVCYKTVQGTGSTGSGEDGANDWGPDGVKNTADDALGLDQIAGTADDHPENSTTSFRDNGAPNGDANAPPGGRVGPDKPENQLWGNMYYGAELSAGAFPMQIPATNAQGQFSGDRIWRNTGIATGTTTTIGTNLTGWEWDAIPTQAQYLAKQPAGVKPLNQSSIPLGQNVDWLQDEGRIYAKTPSPGQCACAQAVKYTAASGALVFSAGTNDWANALAPNPDSRLIQATYNILSDMGVQPVTPVGVTLDPPSGPQPPTASFTVGPNPAQTGQVVTFNGSASSDPDGPIAKYEWDLDGDGSYELDTGTTATATHTYSSTGVLTVRLRVTDAQGVRSTTNRALSIDNSANGSYPSRVLGTNGLVSYWRMGDPSGTTLVDATGNNNATTAGGPTLGTPGALSNDPDTSVGFDGTNDTASANLNLTSTSAVTVEFWMRWNSYSNNDALAMEFTPNFNATAGGFLIDPNAGEQGGQFAVALGNNASRNTAYFQRPSAGVWHHYAFVLDTTAAAATQITPYVDGKPVTYTKTVSGTGAGTFANSQLNMMSRGGTSLFGNGNLDEVAVYARALNATTIASHFAGNPQAPTASFTSTPDPPQTGQVVTFNGSASSSPIGTITKYEWDLDGNGSYETDTGTTATTTHTYSAAGPVDVKLRVTDSTGATGTTTVSLTVEAPGNGSYTQRVTNTAGLTHYWRMGELAGTTLGDSKGTSPATTSGGPALGAPGAVAGDSDTSVRFNGTTSAATANVDLSASSKLTIEFWLKWNAYANDDRLAMEFTASFNGTPGGFLVDPNAPEQGGKFAVAIGSGLGRNNVYFARPSAGAWHHYAFVIDTAAPAANEILPYVDGQAVAFTKNDSGTGAGNFANSQLYFMSRAASSLFGAGDLDEVALYNRALSASTISGHFGGNAQSPTSSFTATPDPAQTGQTVSFNASASSDPDGTIAKYEWDLDGNGSFETDTGTTATTTRTYATAGTVTVGLRVTDNAGNTDTSTQSLAIEAPGTGSYASRVLATAGLTNYWRMGEASGTTLADSKGSAPATLTGTPTLGAPGAVSSDTDTSVSFNGTNSAASANLNLSATNKLTIEFWLNWDAYANNDRLAMEFTPNFNQGPGGFLVDPNAPEQGGQFGVAIGSGGARNNVYFARPSAGAWHHYAFVLDASAPAASQITPYVDGQPVAFTKTASGTGGANFANSQLYLMSRAANSLFGSGDLDEVAIYNRALTAATISDHYSGTGGTGASAPVASFTASPSTVASGQTVNFDASASSDSDGTIAKYEWDLDGNGSYETDTGTTATTTKSYPSSRTVDVRLRVTDNSAANASTTRTVTVTNRGPTTSFVYTPNPVVLGQPVTFNASASSDPDGTIAKYEWDLDGNGTFETDTGTTATTTHTYTSATATDVKARVTDNEGATDTQTHTLSFGNQVPTASFTATPASAPTGQAIAFDATASSDPDGTIAKYEWDLDGNGSYETDTGLTKTTSRTYATSGTVTVGLRVTDNQSATATQTRTVTVTNRAPTASFTATPASATTGQAVAFDATASSDPDGTIAKYEWDLDGNGTYETDTGTTKTTSRTYTAPGSVAVKVRVTDNQGATATQTKTVTVTSGAPTASFTVTPNPAATRQNVTLNAAGSTDPDGTIARYEWDLDNNGTYETDGATTATRTVTFATVGTVTVGLRVTDNSGGTATTTRTLTVTSAYRAAVLATAGISDYWRLDDTGTTAADANGANNTGTYVSAPVTATGLLAGETNAARTFNGTTQYVDLSPTPFGTPAQLSAETWVRTTAAKGAGGYHVLITDTSSEFANGFSLVIDSANRAMFSVARTTGFTTTRGQATSSVTLAPNTTHHIVGTYDGTTVRVYVDGAQVGTAAFTGALTWSGTRDLRLGRAVGSSSATFFLQGTLDEAALYTQALPAATILGHYNSGKP
ncbi:MAG TPA: PKD domain-containing protein [Baekduia sp.]|nr:PKD domain-containing protein [Baekduia sp.]